MRLVKASIGFQSPVYQAGKAGAPLSEDAKTSCLPYYYSYYYSYYYYNYYNVDEVLSLESHVKSISKKIAKVLGVLRRLKSYATQDILIII